MNRIKHRVSYPRPQELAEEAQTEERKEDCSRGTIWTDEEVHYLALHYGRFPVKFIAKHLRRSPMSVRIMAFRIRHGRKKQHADEIRKSGNVSRLTSPQVVHG